MIARAAGRPWTDSETTLLMSLWCGSNMNGAQIVAELAPRRASEVFAKIDELLRPARPLFCDDWEHRELERALMALPGRAQPCARLPGGFVLDGRPADAAQIVAAANETLAGLGYPPIAWSRVAPRFERASPPGERRSPGARIAGGAG